MSCVTQAAVSGRAVARSDWEWACRTRSSQPGALQALISPEAPGLRWAGVCPLWLALVSWLSPARAARFPTHTRPIQPPPSLPEHRLLQLQAPAGSFLGHDRCPGARPRFHPQKQWHCCACAEWAGRCQVPWGQSLQLRGRGAGVSRRTTTASDLRCGAWWPSPDCHVSHRRRVPLVDATTSAGLPLCSPPLSALTPSSFPLQPR